MKKLVPTGLTLLLLLAASPPQVTPNADRWMVVSIASSPLGYYHIRQTADPDGTVSTAQESLVVINRMGTKVRIASRFDTKESQNGELESFDLSLQTSAAPVLVHGTVSGTSLSVQTTAGGKSYSRTQKLTAPLLGPFGERLLTATLHNPNDAIGYSIFVPDVMAVANVHRSVESVSRAGDATTLTLAQTVEGVPGTERLTISAAADLLNETASTPFGAMQMVAADERTARLAANGGALNPEVFSRTIAISNVRLPDPRAIRSLSVVITQQKAQLGFPEFPTSTQRVRIGGERATIDVWQPLRPQEAIAGTPPPAEYTAPNAIIASDDPLVVRVAREVTQNDASAYEKSVALQAWTHDHMRFDLGVALTPAAEVIRNRRGTCLAFAVLLASLERAAGIPSRVVYGLVYEESMWGGHAWTESYVDGAWIPFDAAMYAPGPADAARIAIATTSFADGGGTLNSAGLQIFGNVAVRVLRYNDGTSTVDVPAGAKPYRIAGNRYENPWLGLTLEKPSAFEFQKLDAVYPDDTVVEMASVDGARMSVEESSIVPAKRVLVDDFFEKGDRLESVRISGLNGWASTRPRHARAVLVQGSSVWVLTATGPKANELLRYVATSMHLAG
jgi:hypothetical protein